MTLVIVPTDLSPASDHAARYAFFMARKLKASIRLCHAFQVLAEQPFSAQIAWPLEDFTSIKKGVLIKLKHEAKKLEHLNEHNIPDQEEAFYCSVDYDADEGVTTDVIRAAAKHYKGSLIVMGMIGASEISRFFMGSNSRSMIEKSEFPLLLIPEKASFKPLNKIAFATDLSRSDIEKVCSLATLARHYNAEILLVHITEEQLVNREEQHKIDRFLEEITARANYPKIYYRHLKSMKVDEGLNWITQNGQIDMLAVVHRHHGMLERIIQASHTAKLSHHITIPLLAMPEHHQFVL